jgi:cell division protein FtsQ
MRVAAPSDKRFRRAHVKPARRRRSLGARLRLLARVLSAVAFFGGGGYLFAKQVAGAESLHVERIVVRGNQRLPTGEVLTMLAGLRGEHVLSVNLEFWRRRVLESPWVEHAAVRRMLPSTIEVLIHEREPMAIGRIGADLYLIDPLGRIIDDYGPNYAQFDLPIVDGLASRPTTGAPLVDDARAGLAYRTIEGLRQHQSLFRRVSQIEVVNERNAVVMLQGDTAPVHLGDELFAERLQTYVDLAAAVREQVPDVEYVDMRFENRIYVRPAGSARRREIRR